MHLPGFPDVIKCRTRDPSGMFESETTIKDLNKAHLNILAFAKFDSEERKKLIFLLFFF